MDGFVPNGWIRIPDGRITFIIWETAEQLAACDAFIADFVAAHPVITQNGTTEVYAGAIGYADVLGRRLDANLAAQEMFARRITGSRPIA